MSKQAKEQNVRVDAKVPVTIELKGKIPDGKKCHVKFFTDGPTGLRQDVEDLDEDIKENKIAFEWTAKAKNGGGLEDDDISALVHCEIQLQDALPGSASDYLEFRVWASEFTVKILNSEDNDSLYTNAYFQLKNSTGGYKTLRFNANNDAKDGMKIALAEFAEPELKIAHPYEIVGTWTKKPGRVLEAKAKKKPFKAVFTGTPGASTEEGKYKRVQYVNIEGSQKFGEGHLVKIGINAEPPVAGAADLYVELTFSGANGGERSKRNLPLPELINADSNDKNTTYKKTVKLQGTAGTHIDVELGLAGGDVCTIKIGATDKCEDGSLEITNWRRIGFILFIPDTELSSFGKLSDTQDGSLSDKDLADIKKELDKAFIEYKCVKVQKYDLKIYDDLKYQIVDPKFIGRSGGSKAFWADDEFLKRMLPKVKAALDPDVDKPYYHSAIVVDRIMQREKSDGAVTVTMTSGTKEVKLHDSDYYCPPYRVGIRGIFGGVRMLAVQFTKIGGTEIDPKSKEGKEKMLISSTMDFATQDAAMKKYIEFIDSGKIKVTFPKGTEVGDIFAEKSGVEANVKIGYAKFKDAEAVGMCIGSELLAYPSMGCFILSQGLFTTIIHEVMHLIDFAYMDPTDPQGKPRTHGSKHPIPGVPYRTAVPEGFVYEGHGHQGGHCATGLDADKRKKDDFTSTLGPMNWAPTCLNWGQDVFRFSDLVLCDECALYARAQDLRDLSKLG